MVIWGGRWAIIAAVVVGAVAAFPLVRAYVPYDFTARTSLVWEKPPGVEGGEAQAPRELRTMVDSVELPTNLAKVRQRLHIKETVPEIGAWLDVSYDFESNLVTVTAMSHTATRAARLANTAVDVFLEHRRRVEEGRRTELIRALDADVDRARADLEASRGAYDRFRRQHGISDLSTETQQAIEMAASLRAQADMARAEALAEDARARTLRTESRRLGSTTLTETVVTSSARPASVDQERLVQAEAELTEARVRLSDDHPTVQTLVAKVAALRSRAAAAAAASPVGPQVQQANKVRAPNAAFEALRGSLVGSTAQREVALERNRSYEELAAAAQQRLERLSAIEGQASQLLAAQRVAEAHATELREMRARAVDAARSPSTGLRIVARALPPEEPESSRKQTLLVALAPLASGLLAVVALLLLSLRGFRAYTAVEVAFWGKGPVVGSSQWPNAPGRLDELLQELEDSTPSAFGRTLVVGATPGEDDIAREVAFGLRELGGMTESSQPTQVVVIEEQGSWSGDRPSTPSKKKKKGGGGGIESPASRTALARVGPERGLVVSTSEVPARAVEAWQGVESGPTLRRAARLADRVLVVLRSGALSVAELARLRTRLGREDGVGYLVVGVDAKHSDLPDRAGPVDEFWKRQREDE